MATKRRGGLLLPLMIVVAAAAVFGSDEVIDSVTGAFGGVIGRAETVGRDDGAFMVASSAKAEVDGCDKRELTTLRKCKIPVLVIDAATMPHIARNIKLAWTNEGKPGVLHREEDPVKQKANRNAACTRAAKAGLSSSCDEFPIVASKEGGAGARIEGVPMEEQCAQGWVVMETARVNNMQDSDPFVVIIVNPNKIATERYVGGMWLGSQRTC